MPAECRSISTDLSEERKKVLRRSIGGAVGGMLQVFCCHPFDTIKARVQRGVSPGVASSFRSTWRLEGIRGFYQGLTPALFVGATHTSILFTINQFFLNLLTPAGEDVKAEPTILRAAFAGELTAPLYVLYLTPMEKVKVKLQVEHSNSANSKFTRPIDCIRYILDTEGARGMFSGYVPTLLSRVVGFPLYFGGYQVTYQALNSYGIGTTIDGKNLTASMLSGCMAGNLFWTGCYPFDYVKTQVQAGEGKDRMSQVFISTYKRGGVRTFYTGLSVCLARTMPANAIIWLGIEWTTKIMKRNGY